MLNLAYHSFPLFSPFPALIARSYERSGGTSQGIYASLNGSLLVGDREKHVLENREKVRADTRLSLMCFPCLEHGVQCREITKENIHQKILADALFTKEQNIALAMTHADCQIALAYDPSSGVIAIIHAGWKGLIREIYPRSLEVLQRNGVSMSALRIGISASIGPNHAEYLHYQEGFPKKYWRYHIGNGYFDFWRLAEDQLRSLGVEHIAINRTCTVSAKNKYFSYRRDRVTGRCIATIGKRSSCR